MESTALHWRRAFPTLQPTSGFAALRGVGCRTAFDPSYRVDGRRRLGMQRCVYHYTLSGQGALEVNGACHTLPPGCGVLHQVGDPRHVIRYPEQGTEPWRFLFISFDGSTALEMTGRMTQRHGYLYELPPDHPQVQRFLAFEAFDDGTPLREADSAELVINLLLALSKAADDRVVTPGGRKLVHQAQALVARHLRENVNVKNIADKLSVSREHLTRTHKEETGMTLHAFIQQSRIRAACKLLCDTKLSHDQIATRLGFGSSSNFARVFKSALSITPRRYRTSHTHSDF